MATETITLRLVAQDLMSGNVSKAVGGLDKLAQRGGLVGSVMQGVGQKFGQMLNPLGLMTNGIGMATDFLMDAAKAAAEDEQSLSRLNTTLKANIPGWERYGDVIATATEEALGLAFADDEVRASLNRLIPQTRDVNEALRLNALAMDIARARGMKLEDAAVLVGKAYGGQATLLRRAGFAITDTKDATKALAEVQAQVAGQAKAYAGTAKGSYETLDLTIQELSETIGYELLPHLKNLADYARTDLIPRIDEVTEGMRLMGEAAKLGFFWVPQMSGPLGELGKGLGRTTDEVEAFTESLAVPPAGAIRFFDTIKDAVPPVIGEMDRLGVSVTRLPDKFRTAVVDMKNAIKTGKTGIIEQFRDLAWQSKHPFAEKRYSTWLGEQAAKATRKMERAARKGRPGLVAQYRQLREDITIEMLLLPRNLARIQQQIDGILGSMYSAVTSAVTGAFNPGGEGAGGVEARASGGPARAGRRYRVGEQGPEEIIMGADGYVAPTHSLAGGGGTVIINMNGLVVAPSEAELDRIARVLAPGLRRVGARAGA